MNSSGIISMLAHTDQIVQNAAMCRIDIFNEKLCSGNGGEVDYPEH